MEKYKEIMKAQHNELNKLAHSHGVRFGMNGKELLKEDPKVVRIDGIRAKDTDTFMGEKI